MVEIYRPDSKYSLNSLLYVLHILSQIMPNTPWKKNHSSITNNYFILIATATNHFMGTMFSKLLLSGDPPESWSSTRISLIYKANDTNDPGNFRMISLTCTVGKLYHQIMANRTASFLISNNVIDPSMQAAFLQGINSCIEHTQIMHEILAHARNKNKTYQVTYFDPTDAFGNEERELIYLAMQRNGLPPVVIQYVKNLYSRLEGYVQGDE